MSNNLLKYTSKDYESIKEDLIESISALTDTWTSREEGDPGIVLVKLMSALGDMLSFNTDAQALEYYAPTVTQRKNAARLFELIGYKMHWYKAAKTTLSVTNKAPMPEYVYIYKQFLEDPTNQAKVEELYLEYYNNYKDSTGLVVSYPPQGEPLSSGEVRCTFTYNNLPTTELEILNSQGSGYNKDGNIPAPGSSLTALDFFKYQYSQTVDNVTTYRYMLQDIFNDWEKTNSVGIHTYIEDPNRTLGVYSSGTASSLIYSLIPTIDNAGIDSSTDQYLPTYTIKPYETKTFPAIQGYLCTTTFNRSQLKDNRYYISDTAIDEDHMYLAYIAVDEGSNKEKPIYLTKTDNLLTVTKFEEENGTTNDIIIYYQFGVDEFDFPYIELASYWDKKIPATATKFKFSYFKTEGKYGNITTNYLTSIDTDSSIDVSVLSVANNDYILDENGDYIAEPGQNPQTAREAYLDSLNYIMTYDTLVTIYDFTRFVKRQNGISNSFSCDKQYAEDVNADIEATVNSYSKSQLLSILGENADSSASEQTLRSELKNIRKINFDYKDNQIKKNTPTDPSHFANYSVNLYPIWGDFETTMDGTSIATLTNQIDERTYPYYVYCINTQDNLSGNINIPEEEYAIETMLNNAIENTHIVNVEPRYTGCRVFKWKCCGTLHLTQSVSEEEAATIIQNVINHLKEVYKPHNMEIGKKLTYMEVIDTVLESDSRIRYFDAGIGSTKLISFTVPNLDDVSQYYNPEAYFNPESIMKYEQSAYDNMILIDPMYIQKIPSGS